MLRDRLDLRELHLTGGEPTLHPGLDQVITSLAREVGFGVAMTSNGENGARVLPACAAAGLKRVNFSIFGTTAVELAQVQDDRYRDATRAERKIHALRRSIETALSAGIDARANIVVPDSTHIPRVLRLLCDYSERLSVRLLNSLDAGTKSLQAIDAVLDQVHAEPEAHYVTAGASGWRTRYRLPTGRAIWVKRIRSVRLPQTCTGCRFNNPTDCQEGYYGVRLYRDRAGGFQVGVCIQRMDLCMRVEQFATSSLRDEIMTLRQDEYTSWTRHSPHPGDSAWPPSSKPRSSTSTQTR
ncbi:radical SAM protein [Fodinicola feengrottensis]|uniref:radical SAM protein n=1 Tax=Fodinicola feengrottensis TaxID=435914 RepID=UPI00244275F7|nr:radical SAM protein [Fodinicola feengrottensis]